MMRPACFVSLVVCYMLTLGALSRADDPATVCHRLLDKAIEACGGATKRNKLNTFTWMSKGKYKVNDNVEVAFTDKGAAQGDRFRLDLKGEVARTTFAEIWIINGKQGWLREVDIAKITDLPKDLFGATREGVHAVRLPLRTREQSIAAAIFDQTVDSATNARIPASVRRTDALLRESSGSRAACTLVTAGPKCGPEAS